MEYPKAELIFLSRAPRRERRGRIWILPVDEFLASLHPGRALLPS